jgi:hypothetical protein
VTEYLDNMILETDSLLLFTGTILNIENTDQIRRPAAHEPIE